MLLYKRTQVSSCGRVRCGVTSHLRCASTASIAYAEASACLTKTSRGEAIEDFEGLSPGEHGRSKQCFAAILQLIQGLAKHVNFYS